jgi:NAD(P)-dependent dehydrogenase (short-subunit alcohol dehydrogenase family)
VIKASAAFSRGYEIDRWLVTAKTGFLGPLIATCYAIEAMRRRGSGGVTVNVSSISALWHGRGTARQVYG